MKKLTALFLALALMTGMAATGFAETRYYLANRELDVGGEEADEPADEYEAPAETGGDAAVTNANANPGTGR